jgi:tellurite resistance protein TerC
MSWSERIHRLWNLENIKIVRRIIVSVIGGTVLLIGIALTVLPGPAFIVIPIGLAILATEFAWARHWLKKVRQIASGVVSGRAPPNQNGQTRGAVRKEEPESLKQD